MFELDPVLARDTIKVGEFPLSELRIMNDSRFPWFILIPRRAGISEIYQLGAEDRVALMEESCLLAETLHDAFSGDKLNVAALGNVVHQLHLHHVVRYASDPCWPQPIWGKLPAVPYTEDELASILQKVRVLLADDLKSDDEEDGQLYY